jgi:hypothetical protein
MTIEQKAYEAAMKFKADYDKVWNLRHFGEFSLGDSVSSILSKDARSYCLKPDEWQLAYNMYVQGKSPLQIAEAVCEQRGFNMQQRMSFNKTI